MEKETLVQPAGFWIRLIANIVDGLIVGITLGIIGLILFGPSDPNQLVTNEDFALNILSLMYAIFIPLLWYGYTVGKRAFGIRIARVDGEALSIGTMLLRTLVGALVYTITLGIGLIVSAFMVGLRQDKRAIHDLIAGTYVTYQKPDLGQGEYK